MRVVSLTLLFSRTVRHYFSHGNDVIPRLPVGQELFAKWNSLNIEYRKIALVLSPERWRFGAWVWARGECPTAERLRG